MKVAKKLIAYTIDAAMSGGRLKIPASDPLAQTLISELRAFTVRTTAAGNETMAALRAGDHDDLVIAAGLAIWSAENRGGGVIVGRLAY